MIKVVLAGGGTAGHTSPLIATAEALTRLGKVKLTAIGTPRGLETSVIPQAGLDLQLIPAVPMPRKPNLDLVKLPVRLHQAVNAAQAIIEAHEADVLVGFGGYVAMPAYLAARKLGVPIVIHEQNAIPGLANEAAAQFATRVFTSFPDTPLPNATFAGLPLRTAIANLAKTGRASGLVDGRKHFGLNPDLPCLLVSGGSQGARSLNEATIGAKKQLLANGVQILHVWGKKNFSADLTVEYDEVTKAGYFPVPYVEDMAQAYAAADLMLARSGAGTVVETAAIGLPAVFVPLPIGNGEQARNADAVVAAGAAVLVTDQQLNAQRLIDEVVWRVKDASVLHTMSEAGQTLMSADAADFVGKGVLEVALDPLSNRGGSLVGGFSRLLSDKLRRGKR